MELYPAVTTSAPRECAAWRVIANDARAGAAMLALNASAFAGALAATTTRFAGSARAIADMENADITFVVDVVKCGARLVVVVVLARVVVVPRPLDRRRRRRGRGWTRTTTTSRDSSLTPPARVLATSRDVVPLACVIVFEGVYVRRTRPRTVASCDSRMNDGWMDDGSRARVVARRRARAIDRAMTRVTNASTGVIPAHRTTPRVVERRYAVIHYCRSFPSDVCSSRVHQTRTRWLEFSLRNARSHRAASHRARLADRSSPPPPIVSFGE